MNQITSTQRLFRPALWVMGLAVMLAPLGAASAASYGVRDNAHFFSADAIRQAEQNIQQIEQRHHKDMLVETLPAIPDELHGQYEQQGKDTFFPNWTKERARQNAVDGVYILIVKSPGHLEVWDGNKTQQRLFPAGAAQQLKNQLLTAFRNKQYDQGLLQATQFVQQQMDQNVPSGNGATAVQRGSPGFPVQTPVQRPSWGIGGIACVIIGVVLLILLVRGIFGRSGSSYGGGGYYPPGGYPQGGAYLPGGYPPSGGYGGGGGGFGRGFLGGLLGGALGGYAADRWINHGQQGGSVPPPSGGDFSSGVDTGGTTTGGDFGSSDASSGADFGSSGGDFGGGGGGDFGGGGGGDSGSSSGGDF